jgi:predicted nucleic acid-binding protein
MIAESKEMLAWLVWMRRTDAPIHVCALTLVEATDGSARDADVRRVVKALTVEAVTEDIAYAAGRLRARAARIRRKARDVTVDAVVAATALSLASPAVVLTSDPKDFLLLLADTGVRVESIA